MKRPKKENENIERWFIGFWCTSFFFIVHKTFFREEYKSFNYSKKSRIFPRGREIQFKEFLLFYEGKFRVMMLLYEWHSL